MGHVKITDIDAKYQKLETNFLLEVSNEKAMMLELWSKSFLVVAGDCTELSADYITGNIFTGDIKILMSVQSVYECE